MSEDVEVKKELTVKDRLDQLEELYGELVTNHNALLNKVKEIDHKHHNHGHIGDKVAHYD